MDNIFDHCKFALEVAWNSARYELSGHITLVVVTVAVLLLVWIFFSSGASNKSH